MRKGSGQAPFVYGAGVLTAAAGLWVASGAVAFAGSLAAVLAVRKLLSASPRIAALSAIVKVVPASVRRSWP